MNLLCMPFTKFRPPVGNNCSSDLVKKEKISNTRRGLMGGTSRPKDVCD